MALRMRQSLATFEEELREHLHEERLRSQRQFHQALHRTRKRKIEQKKKRTSMRFWLLVGSLVATAVGVTVAMFETLYWLLG